MSTIDRRSLYQWCRVPAADLARHPSRKVPFRLVADSVAMGACMIERHITLDRTMWGTDHAASLGPSGVERLVRDIRIVEEALGSPEKRVMEREIAVMQKLRRVGG